MNKMTLISMALLSTSAISASALAEGSSGFDGYLSAAAGSSKTSMMDESNRASSADLRGTFAYTHSSGFGIQIDNAAEQQTVDLFEEEIRIRAKDLAIHPFYRRDNFLVAGFYQTRDFKLSAPEESSFTAPLDRRFKGAQAQYDFGRFTLAALVASDKVSLGGNAFSGRSHVIEGRYFFRDNLRADVSFTRSRFIDLVPRAKTTAVVVEYKFTNSPFSLFAKYQDSNGSGVEKQRYVLGAKLNFGTETLRARNASGASLNPVAVDNQVLGILFGNFFVE